MQSVSRSNLQHISRVKLSGNLKYLQISENILDSDFHKFIKASHDLHF